MLRVGTQTHVQWMNMQKNNRDSCTHLVVWKDTGPVRGVWTGAVRRWRASTGWREQDPVDTDRCGMMSGLRVGAGCCQDRDQLNPPSERRQPLLGYSTPPSSLPSEADSQRNRCFETVLCFGSVEPIRNAFVNLDCYERTWFHNLCDLVEHIIKQY